MKTQKHRLLLRVVKTKLVIFNTALSLSLKHFVYVIGLQSISLAPHTQSRSAATASTHCKHCTAATEIIFTSS